MSIGRTTDMQETSTGDLPDAKEEILHNQDLRERIFSEDYMYAFVRNAALSRGYTMALAALPYMKEHHEGQYRNGQAQVPYINHPLMMACHALAMDIADDQLLTILLLHDVCEDCGVKAKELPFDETVKVAVGALTHVKSQALSREEDLKKYYGNIQENKYASIAKLIDRCNNVSLMAMGFTRQRMQRYIIETETYVLPLVDKVRNEVPEYYNAAFLLKYQMMSVLESLKRVL